MSRNISVPWLVTLAFVLLFASFPTVRSAQNSPGEDIKRNLEAFHSDDDFIIYEAVNALGEIGTRAVPFLIELFETGSLEVRYRAARALNAIGERSRCRSRFPTLAMPSCGRHQRSSSDSGAAARSIRSM